MFNFWYQVIVVYFSINKGWCLIFGIESLLRFLRKTNPLNGTITRKDLN